MVWSCKMPSDIMEQRHISSFYRPSVPSSLFSEEMRFRSEKQGAFWRTASMPDRHGLEAMSFISGGKPVSSSPLQKVLPVGGNFVNGLELQRNHFKDQTRNIPHNYQSHFVSANCWRAPDQEAASLSKLYGQPASLSVGNKKVTVSEGFSENGLLSDSFSDTFNNKLRLSSNDVFVGQSVNTTQSNCPEDDIFESLEEIEAQTIGDLLPDDDDLLSGVIHDLGDVSSSNRIDVEDDVFCSIGGIELESDDSFSCKRASEYEYGSVNGQEMGFNDILASQLPQSKSLTRTLLVKNIDGNVGDMELRALFEQYGDIQTLCTSYRRCGFIIVSYYDIRAAHSAISVLQAKSIRGQKLDIQFCVSKGHPSERENEGVLLVTNLESSISYDNLLHIFGVYGEIKEICEIPHKKHHKIVEFYDVRAAKDALSALDMRDIAGKRMKVEQWCLKDESLMQQLSMDMEEEDSIGCIQESNSQMLPSECFVPSGPMTNGVNNSSGLHTGAIHGLHTASAMQNRSNMCSKFHADPSSAPRNLSSPVNVSLEQMNLRFQSMSTIPHDGITSGLSFNSPGTMSAVAMNASSALTNGVDSRNVSRVCSGGSISHSFEHSEATFNVSTNGSCPVDSHGYIWNNSRYLHHPSSMAWKNLSPFMDSIPVQSHQPHVLTRAPSHIAESVSPYQHVGSAPNVEPFLWNRRRSFTGDATVFHPNSLGTTGYPSFSPLELASHKIFHHAGGNCIGPSAASAHVAVTSPQQRSHMIRGRNNVNPTPNFNDISHERMRSQRNGSSGNQADSRKQYELDIDRIIRGEDSRTTLMIKNIPNKYTSKMLLATIDEQHKGTYDFIYLPIDFKNKCNVGYAFINMTDPHHIIPFYQVFNGKKWEKFNSEKVAYLAYARIQGKSALIAHFQNSSLMNEDKRCRPIIFHSDGPNAGDQEPFPVGVNIRSRRSRTSTEIHHGSPSDSSGDESSNPGSSSGSA
ncbi:protein MEI2-like 4 isoform X2 [Asparagus officinalis]|uniref:protein MEI2-like 4 isoform X2 n=1 Tax=Asparagus officinalis TaxID=4686 RepID=UPI00098E8687|nr:protein MEI2-like 4 isoform X2 [Asparagus officinalis]